MNCKPLDEYLAEIEAIKERLARIEGVVFPEPCRIPSLGEMVAPELNDAKVGIERMLDEIAQGIEAGTGETGQFAENANCSGSTATPRKPGPKDAPCWRLFGRSEIWRPDSTGTTDFYLFGLRVSRRDFVHSTALR